MIVRKEIINEVTGQVTVSEKQYPDVMNEDGYLFWLKKKQSRSFNDVHFPKEIDYSERGRFLNLVKCLEKDSNCIVKRANKGYTHMTESDIIKILDLEERRAKTLLNKYIKFGLIAKVNIKHKEFNETKFFINPMYFHAGKRLTKTLYRMFAESLYGSDLAEWVHQEYSEIKEVKSE